MKNLHLYMPESMNNTDSSELSSIVNGCGPKGWKRSIFKLPFRLLNRAYHGIFVYACNIHDFMYHTGVTIQDKDEADRVLSNNLMRTILQTTDNTILRSLYSWLIIKYVMHPIEKYGAIYYWSGKTQLELTTIPVIRENTLTDSELYQLPNQVKVLYGLLSTKYREDISRQYNKQTTRK